MSPPEIPFPKLQGRQTLSLLRENFSWALAQVQILTCIHTPYKIIIIKKTVNIKFVIYYLSVCWIITALRSTMRPHNLSSLWSRWKSHTVAVRCPLICPGLIDQMMKMHDWQFISVNYIMWEIQYVNNPFIEFLYVRGEAWNTNRVHIKIDVVLFLWM